MPSNAGRPSDAGRPTDTSRKDTTHRHQDGASHDQAQLRDSQLNSGAWKMLQDKTGKSSDQLKAMYDASGAKNFGQFTSAIVVSKNLGLDTNQVLDGLRTKSLGQTLQYLGVAPDKAKAEIKNAKAVTKKANSHSGRD